MKGNAQMLAVTRHPGRHSLLKGDIRGWLILNRIPTMYSTMNSGWWCRNDRLADVIALAQYDGLAVRVEAGPVKTPVSEATCDLIVDVTELLASGVSPEVVCTRVGRTAAGLERRLRRADRPDLARPFAALSARIYYDRGTKR